MSSSCVLSLCYLQLMSRKNYQFEFQRFSIVSPEIKSQNEACIYQCLKNMSAVFVKFTQCFWLKSGNFMANLDTNKIKNTSEMELCFILPTLEKFLRWNWTFFLSQNISRSNDAGALI